MSALKTTEYMKYFRNLLELSYLFPVLLRNSSKQKRFLKESISEEIKESKVLNDNTLDEYDYQKILLYGYAVPAMLGEAYCTLRNLKMTGKERYSLTFLGSITSLFDDFFDKKKLPDDYIREMIINSFSIIGKDSYEKLFLKLYNKSLESVDDRTLLIENALTVFESQILSRKQKNSDITQFDIETITFEKGGSSMLMYRNVLKNKMDDAEQKLIYKLGGIGQLENDIFDVYKDYKEGIKTLATTMQKTSHLRQKYVTLMAEVFDSVEKTNFPAGSKKRFRKIISLVMSRGLVCLDCIEKNERKTNNEFRIEKYERNDLICNMESFKSFAKLIHYSAKQIL